MAKAAEEVATVMGGDVNKTASELLNKLLVSDNEKSDGQEQGTPKTAPLNLKLVNSVFIEESFVLS